MMRAFLLLLLLFAAGMTSPFADAAPAGAPLALTDTDGVVRHPLDIGSNKAVVLIFISDDCPISNGYAPEINRLCAAYAPKKIAFYLVSVDTGVTAAAIKQHVRQYAYPCPDVIDTAHRLVKQAGATVTPEAAIYAAGGKLLYEGRIDNKYADFGKVRYKATTFDLQSALEDIAAGRPVAHPKTKAVGCFI
jgi:thiol-disulfide isomerase/thioredoxin